MGQPSTTGHVPVMAERTIALLAPALEQGGTYVDCTLGLGGHAEAVLRTCPRARLVGIDRDRDALAIARERLAPFGDRVALYEAVYDELPDVLAEDKTPQVQAILADLGLSSMQIDRRERGFSYSADAPLDMRMSPQAGITAAQVLNTYSTADLTRILRAYGEERFADRIARRIVAEREAAPYETSARLVTTIDEAIPAAARHAGGHPAKRTFQALRIEVNGELTALEGLLPAALDALAPGGRFAVLAYHSLEDRLVKRSFAAATTDTAPRGLPVVPPEHRARFMALTRGAERPSDAEAQINPRAASARLRAVERREVQA
ncbi:16S rRNA (cytosine(1402)-N(4))-methyltransferase RsmH [Propioniciclava flava]|uniref:Ribosomal RNA small subunit methyltransferase H n=1 Tax=Propioniciclava flava TaxID=2072026 RepID=A0A4Q2EID9_9ACTN|nr:16S rRNA (cytosine(1402)-N(4))-methyltransferase RsmH [Propioniciclava flava]RXW32372.1 16S rRNA (cytosine(1402)-N(4))-methyltransferase [Propioniciclava flava]